MKALSKVIPAGAILGAGLITGTLGLLSGCGSAGSSNNDQGTSFTNNGYSAAGAPATDTTGLTGVNIALGLDRPTLVIEVPGDPRGAQVLADGQLATIGMRLQNRLAGQQFIRLVRIDCDYDVPGAEIPGLVPSDSFPVGLVIEAGGLANVAFDVLSPDLYASLNSNRNLLPELPFRMIADCAAVGVTRAGDTVETNRANFLIQALDPAECCTGVGEFGGGGFQDGPRTEEGPGTGGTLDTFEEFANPNDTTTGGAEETELAEEASESDPASTIVGN